MLYPMELEPVYKDYLWGGDRLEKLYGKHSGLEKTAESWELSCHRDGKCHIKNGKYTGMTLSEAIGEEENFPVLVKFIDAKENLSIQVHPSDETANKSAGEQGKAEMWYIVSCEPYSYIYLGFSEELTKERFLGVAIDGSICRYLNKVPVKTGDVFYIRPGTVHALGAGAIVAEIQQNSNTTFRIYDYMRRGGDSKQRPLHLERAADIVNYKPLVPEECRVNLKAHFEDFNLSEMFRCEYFKSYRIDVNKKAALRCDDEGFQHLLFVEGKGAIEYDTKRYPFSGGSSYFLPAGLGEYTIIGKCRVLLTSALGGNYIKKAAIIADNRMGRIITRGLKKQKTITNRGWDDI